MIWGGFQEEMTLEPSPEKRKSIPDRGTAYAQATGFCERLPPCSLLQVMGPRGDCGSSPSSFSVKGVSLSACLLEMGGVNEPMFEKCQMWCLGHSARMDHGGQLPRPPTPSWSGGQGLPDAMEGLREDFPNRPPAKPLPNLLLAVPVISLLEAHSFELCFPTLPEPSIPFR